MTGKQRDEFYADFIRHNKRAKQTNNRFMMYASFEDYLMNRFGKKKYCPPFKEMKVKSSTKSMILESLPPKVTLTSYCCTKPEKKQYTGDYIIGIAQTHKSNAVPVTNQKEIIDIGHMRRN